MTPTLLRKQLKEAEAKFKEANATFSKKLSESGFPTFEALLKGSYPPAKTKELSDLYLQMSEARESLDKALDQAQSHLEKAELKEWRENNGIVS